jgi:hypothetical protein
MAAPMHRFRARTDRVAPEEGALLAGSGKSFRKALILNYLLLWHAVCVDYANHSDAPVTCSPI